ncbi:MAG TPA: cyclic 2,3-diphosphoglycerate synthase [Anaerolineales bacterium]|nr:cyclic 2,3-diphosphoglycerate synthase [Anaerolineales bacterium]HMV95330.1 cyclic 2,3-diphosphoglycerate synthase [Anaerolineales bacterium]HMX17718.1 cyclic 2,3-diphosphoglycerate synthase [Anaerolineales bacterium]HMX73245.1 cyclic 2,3-diphosphoglycerate synthase [Anaerolineales bacterium]HNC91328.1 cyclic 2,3-diphosphoglycerate synthase [Anaerolineales bacterium]
MPIKTLIMGAAGRDFHNFNTFFRGNKDYEVVAFTATQIPDIEGRVYPAELAGAQYPKGIPIRAEEELLDLIKKYGVEQVVFSYSDVPHEYVMHKAAMVNAAGADFRIMGTKNTQLKSNKPVVSISAVRTGSGKSQTTRRVALLLKEMGYKVAAIRHPMPYGNLVAQEVQRYASYDDLDEFDCTIEEREEYEPHIDCGVIIYAGVDYEKIIRQAEAEADIILWDGGNNDFPFYTPDLQIVIADPHRTGHESTYYPGETNVRMADVFVINKVDTADAENVIKLRENLRKLNPNATQIEAASPLFVDDPDAIQGKRVLVIEDGPTLTHGEMAYGAGYIAARRFGAKEIVDPRPFAVKSIAATYAKYPKTGPILPAMGYGDAQTKDLEATINASDVDLVVIGTPIDLSRVMKITKPHQRVRYELQEIGVPTLKDVLMKKFGAKK